MVNPQGLDLLQWADTIFVDFPTNDVPILVDPTDWKTWGNDLVACTTFELNNAPGTDDYTDWYGWAQEVYYSMANYA